MPRSPNLTIRLFLFCAELMLRRAVCTVSGSDCDEEMRMMKKSKVALSVGEL